jgi:tRNA pseudouridine38-40 synthase
MCAQPAKRRFAMLLAYDGAAFHGWQMQTDRTSVQETVGDALLAAGLPPSVNGASRTDRGVHARAMVASTAARTGLSNPDLVKSLRARLPDAVRLRAISEVGPDFHAQFSSRGKSYRYRIHIPREAQAPVPRFAWTLHPEQLEVRSAHPFSLKKLMLALEAMKGERPFSGVMAPNAKEGLCNLTEARLLRQLERTDGTWLTLSFRSNRFGKYMVRTLAGVAVRCAVGELDPTRLSQQLDSGLFLGHLIAPPEGLVLWKVHYPARSRSTTGDPFPWLRG